MSWTLDVTVFDEWGDHVFAQAKYLVHGFDDVLWTNDIDSVIAYLKDDLIRLKEK